MREAPNIIQMANDRSAVVTWLGGPSVAYIVVLLRTMTWRLAIALALTLLVTATQGMQLLLLVPLMQLVGLDVQQGSIGWLARSVVAAFEFVGLPLTLATVLVLFMLFTTVLAFLTRVQANYNIALEHRFVAILRARFYRAIVNASWLTFSKGRSSDFTHALTGELDRVGLITSNLLRVVTNCILVSIYLLFALRVSLMMTAAVFAAGLILVLSLRSRDKAARWLGTEISTADGGMYSAAIEHLGGMKTVKSYGAEERNTRIFSGLSEQVARAYIAGNRNNVGAVFWFTVGSAAILCVILYVSSEVLGITAAGLLLLLFLFNRMVPLFNSIRSGYERYHNQLPAFISVMELQARCEAAAEPKAMASQALEFREIVRFEGVSFSYGGEGATAAVQDLYLTIEAGKTTAIVGSSGAGKSTVADLVMGLIKPDRGRVLVDGKLLSHDLLRSWREHIGYVAQETFLFNDTVRSNLLWANPEAGENRIREALRLAAAEGFVSELPNGLQTVLGDRGVRLSGGERQRLALAMALLREPSLLILDEATSALDSENERRIQNAIEGLHGRMSILIITHRLSTIRGADIVHVLERGRLVESGSWEALMSNGDGRFSALAMAQGILR